MSKRFPGLGERAARYAALPKEPLLITLRLGSPFAVTGWLPLDGTLHWLVKRDLSPEEFEAMCAEAAAAGLDEENCDVPLPLDEREAAGRHYWAASFGAWQGIESVTRWHKRWDEQHDDLVDFDKRPAKVFLRGGHFLTRQMPLVIHSAPEITFWAMGNRAEVQRLLGSCNHIGKAAASGYGRIRDVLVEPRANDRSCWREGWPTRAIPVGGGEGLPAERLAYTGYRPPYWWPANQATCLAPEPSRLLDHPGDIDWFEAVGGLGEVPR
jgi:hypothetical protein